MNASEKSTSQLVLASLLRCPYCGFEKSESMPTDACQYFYECTNCHRLLRPTPGNCCVFCSFGTVKCPPVQLQRGCCG
ncbi:GDCCVxC domain-containing (seleno)protein [uncultured Piscinibacter sp.]|uniref:GDCCVxC domain-containing (seleno)protein n=1 Tax=uncultured Piscinibacter sp. TaxID=1131835 RepID=UPI00261D231D|nr:GDCCVxC domain-containing (seleno)protein [uncultured Piscinibacter sp.]